MSVLIKLYNVRKKHRVCDNRFIEMLKVVKDFLKDGNEFPSSIFKIKRTLNQFGMKYEKIHLCPKNFIVYKREYEDVSSFPICCDSRQKITSDRTNMKKDVLTNV